MSNSTGMLTTRQRTPRPLLNDHYTFIIGPSRAKLTIHSTVFDLYAPDFHKESPSVYPTLTPLATKITFEFCSSRYTGIAPLHYDSETLQNCYDVYNCAETWGIQALKTHVCQVISSSNILANVEDYGGFLAQVYQLYLRLLGQETRDQSLSDALTRCLRTISEEHRVHPGASRAGVRSRLHPARNRDEEMQDTLDTEFNRLNGGCSCVFCRHQRANYGKDRRGRLWGYKAARADLIHDSKAIWSNGLSPLRIIASLVFTTWTLAMLGWLVLLLGPKTVFRGCFRKLVVVLTYFLLLAVLQFALAVLIAGKFIFDELQPVFKLPVNIAKWVAWKVVFPQLPSARSCKRLLLYISPVLIYLSYRISRDYVKGNGPFDQLTKLILKDNPWLAGKRVFHYYAGIRDPKRTAEWVKSFRDYLDKFEKVRRKAF
ncbi:hypothetical protein TWF481_011032 [Arthrobotrys musiformis]|uniref:BTB domain-containing protein n=1 Tax=Arthrobotrys musiformis TaxID=47236 RepID=A0AAV9VZL3_9PEZI